MKQYYKLKRWPVTFLIKKNVYQEMKHFFTVSSEINYIDFLKYRKTSYIKKETPSKNFSYKLDDFQKQAIKCIIKKENIIVAAHTSSGKTVIAEYTIANTLFKKKKVIYTSPIKALSNQKFRDFSKLFVGVGLMTGDVTINSNADCIVMTTEILRTFLYDNILVKNQLEWVILDETHYIKDRERGFVWEEILILLPKNVKILCLSATIPNTREFAEWIVDIKKTTIHIIQTSKRPVILQHYIFSWFNPGLHIVTSEKGFFVRKKYWQVFTKLKTRNIKYKKKNYNLKEEIKKIVLKIFKIGYWPVIIFSFGKHQSFQLLFNLKKKKFCKRYETKIIRTFFRKCFYNLSVKIKKFLRLKYIFYFFKRGLAIHHSGVLPLIREITEILFQATLIKVLFATETLSIGLNIPAKTVIFSNLTKFDGQNLRILNKSEFIQMSGRAGRRGLDDKGIVITLIDNFTDKKKIEEIIRGKTEPVISMFRLCLNTILKNIRNKKMYDVSLISNSFFLFQNCLIKEREQKILIQIKSRILQLIFPHDKKVSYLYKIWKLYERINLYLKNLCFFNDVSFEIFESKLSLRDQVNKIYFFKTINTKIKKLILVFCSFLKKLKWIKKSMIYLNIDLYKELIIGYLIIKLAYIKNEICWDIMEINGSQSNSVQIISICLIKLSIQLYSLFFIKNKFKEQYETNFIFVAKKKIINLIFSYKNKYINLKNKILFFKETKKLNKTLKLLKIIDCQFKLTIKGLACSDLNFEDDILLIELVFSGKLNNLCTERLASLIGIFFSQDHFSNKKLHPDIKFEIKWCQKLFKKMQEICQSTMICIKIAKYLNNIYPTIPNIIYQLCIGVNFFELTHTNILLKGTIGKEIKRLKNLLIQLSRVSEKLGNINLSIKFDNCSSKLEKSLVVIKYLYF